MKFIQKLLGCCRKEKLQKAAKKLSNSFVKTNSENAEGRLQSINDHLESLVLDSNSQLPRWVEMKCNSLVYLKQVMKFKRKKKVVQMHVESEKEPKSMEKSEKSDVAKIEEVKEAKEVQQKESEESSLELAITPQMQCNDYMSMMCPICLFFMYKSVCASCGHMFCQFCLDDYLIFKESCPVCEKSIRRGKITKWCVADSAIEKMLSFTNEEYFKEWEDKRKTEEKFYRDRQLETKDIARFNEDDESDHRGGQFARK